MLKRIKRHVGVVWAFVIGTIGLIVLWLRYKVAPASSEAHDQAVAKVEETKSEVAVAVEQVEVAAAEQAQVAAQVAEKTEQIDAKAEADKARDSVDVANEIIGG
jgi:hypothetical protein